MSNDKPITLEQLFRYKKPWGQLPHQDAAVIELEEDLQANGYDVAMSRSRPWFKAWSQAGKQPDPIYLAPAEKIIKEFEGCRLEAYPDPSSGGEPITIGWGTTSVNGAPVRLGDKISQALADELLRAEILRLAEKLHQLIPASANWGANQQAALISWMYNVGTGAAADSTLRKRINAGEAAPVVVREELPRWRYGAGEAVLPGLERRRAAEVALFTGTAPVMPQQPAPAYGNPLQVPWYAQMDSATPQAARMCFSSSCAMLLEYLKPGTLKGPNGDDLYLKRVQQYGDTTDPNAQVKALASYGIKARFTKTASFATLEQQIKAGIPIPCGYLHRGPVSKPSGGGHWLCVVGINPNAVIVHDPFGEADLVTGATLNKPARFCSYSRKNWGPRWMVEGTGTGWAILAER